MTTVELVKILGPAFLVFIAAWLPVWYFLKNEQKRRQAEALFNQQKIFTPVQIQAYERMILLLERISPQSLVLRTQNANMSASDLQQALLKSVRKEFEHNMAQQLYVSDKAWEMIKTAKETIVKKINHSAVKVKPENPAIQLSKLILESHIAIDKDPAQEAITYLKKEMRYLFAKV
jgi:hypothetical protein